MQGSYILLASSGIFLLIGGARRVLGSFRLKPVVAVLIIIAIIIGNIFPPIGNDIRIHLGTLILILLSLFYLLNGRGIEILGRLASVAIIVALLTIYYRQIIDRFDVGELAYNVMIISGTAIASFILSKNSGQAFTLAVVSLISYSVVVNIMNNQTIVIGDNRIFELIIYSSLGAVLLNEVVNELISVFSDRSPDLRFEAGSIDDKDDERDSK